MARSRHETALLRIYALLADDGDNDWDPKAGAKVAAAVAKAALGAAVIHGGQDDADVGSLCARDAAKARRLFDRECDKVTRADVLLHDLNLAVWRYRGKPGAAPGGAT